MRYNHFYGQVKMITILPEKVRRHRGLNFCWIQIELYADGKPMIDYRKSNVNLRELENSLLNSGSYWIFCCGCGYAYCPATGERLVHIRYGGNYIEWSNGENLSPGKYLFKKEQYAKVVRQLKEDLYSFFSLFDGCYDGYVLSRKDGKAISAYPDDLLENWARETGFGDK